MASIKVNCFKFSIFIYNSILVILNLQFGFFLTVEHLNVVDGGRSNDFFEVHAVVERVGCYSFDADGQHDAAQVAAVVEAGGGYLGYVVGQRHIVHGTVVEQRFGQYGEVAGQHDFLQSERTLEGSFTDMGDAVGEVISSRLSHKPEASSSVLWSDDGSCTRRSLVHS